MIREWREGERRLLARRLETILFPLQEQWRNDCRPWAPLLRPLAGYYGRRLPPLLPQPSALKDEGERLLQSVLETLTCLRRGEKPPHSLRELVEELVGLLSPEEVASALQKPLESLVTRPPRPQGGFGETIRALARYLRKPTSGSLVEAARVLYAALRLPCAPHAGWEGEYRRLEELMHMLGLALGLLSPLVFLLGFAYYRSLALALIGAAIVIILWMVVRSLGAKYALAAAEAQWHACRPLEGAQPPRERGEAGGSWVGRSREWVRRGWRGG